MARKVTQLESNYINLDNLPKRNDGKIDWFNSCNYDVEFVYCNITGVVKIVDVKRENNATFLTILYGNKTIRIRTENFRSCKIGKLLSHDDANDILIK